MVVLHADQVTPLLVEKRYSTLQVPEPPVPSATLVKVSVDPLHTFPCAGEAVAVGTAGSGTTFHW